CIVKGVPKMLFGFAQRLTNTLLFGDMAIELFDVMARLFGLGRSYVHVLHVGPVGKVDDRNDRNRRHEGKEADVADETGDDGGRRCAGKVSDRRPKKIL